ncbi:membrane protein [Nocardioides montaniterrae]
MTTLISTLSINIDWGGIFGDNLKTVISFIPKLVVFLVILFIGWIIAKAVAKGLAIVLTKVGFTKVLDKAGADQALAAAEIKPIDLIAKLVYYFVLLIALQLALTAFGPTNPVSQIVDDIVHWLPKAFVAIIIVVIAGAVANAVKDILAASLGGVSYGALLAKIVAGFIVALGVIAALNQVGIGLSVTLPVLIAVLGTISGILIVGVGGGLIGPMARRWDGWLDSISAESKRAGNAAPAHAAPTASTAVPPAPPQV